MNLPRKFKISVTGCPIWCSYPEINDVGLTAIRRVKDGREEVGYSLRVGGGLSTEPHMAVRLNAFVPQDKALATVTAVCEIFREQQDLRENRTRARLKYLFMRHGWTAESMLSAVEEKLGFRFDPCDEGAIADDVYRDHGGVRQQKQEGLSSVGATVLRGRLNADIVQALADLADKYGDGQLRTTIMQNVVLVNVRNERVQELVAELGALGLQVEPSVFFRGAVACTGTEFCKLAIAETKGFAKWLVDEMEERLPGVRSADQAACDWLHEQLWAALDCGYRAGGQEDQERRRAGGCILLLRGRRCGRACAGGSADRVPCGCGGLSGGD